MEIADTPAQAATGRPKQAPDYQFDLWYLRAELRGWLAGHARILREQGAEAAPAVILDIAKCLLWNAPRLDRVTHPCADWPEKQLPTIAEIANDLRLAALPLVDPKPAVKSQTFSDRMASLETEIAALKSALANRKGEVQ